MKAIGALIVGGIGLMALSTGVADAQLERLLKDLPSFPSGVGGTGISDSQIEAGLKEALRVGTDNAVRLTGRTDGYFANQAIKILMPERLRTLETGLRAVGYSVEIDEFVLSMNRAAERAAPLASGIFIDAITAMTFDDARRILGGSDIAATEYFRT